MDVEAARRDVVEAARALSARHPEVGAILFECTNMVPYAADVRAATRLPVHSILNRFCWLQAILRPPRFPQGRHSPQDHARPWPARRWRAAECRPPVPDYWPLRPRVSATASSTRVPARKYRTVLYAT